MNRQSFHFVEQILNGGYFFTLSVTCIPSALLLSFLSPSIPRRPQALHFPSQAVFVRQLRLWTTRKVDRGFVLLVAIDVLEMYHHVQSIGEDEE